MKHDQPSDAERRERPRKQRLIPQRESECEEAREHKQQPLCLMKTDQRQQSADQEEMLERDGTPVPAHRHQVRRIRREQSHANEGGALSHGPQREPVEPPHAERTDEQGGEADALRRHACHSKDRTPHLSLQRSDVGHHHRGVVLLEDADERKELRRPNRAREKRLVRFDTRLP